MPTHLSPFQNHQYNLLLPFLSLPMAFSSAPKFIHFPNSLSPPIPNRPPSSTCSFLLTNSKNYKSPSLYTRHYPPPSPPPPPAKRRSSLCVKCNGDAESSAPQPEKRDGNKNEILETVHKVYKEIKNKDITQLSESEVIADEYPDVCDYFPFFRILQTKSEASAFFADLIKILVNSLVFIVRPTAEDGTTMGLKWRLGWRETLIPLGKGSSIQHNYGFGGTLSIRNVEMIKDALLQVMPMRLMNLNWVPKQKSRSAASLCLGFFLLVLSLFFFKFSLR